LRSVAKTVYVLLTVGTLPYSYPINIAISLLSWPLYSGPTKAQSVIGPVDLRPHFCGPLVMELTWFHCIYLTLTFLDGISRTLPSLITLVGLLLTSLSAL